MSEDLEIATGTKEQQYLSLLPQIEAVINGESDLIANLANISACLHYQFRWLWVGFYLVKENDLVLGPFQGPLACTRIKKGKGVCGKAWEEMHTVIVPDVNIFPGHIACSSLSVSEIVVPIIKDNEVIAVLDCDSEQHSHFDKIDQLFLEELVSMIKF
ncbi:MAG: GAF domain-containing protein [Flavitalea sp.]